MVVDRLTHQISFMFIRCKTIKQGDRQYQYYQVVQNRREKSKVRQRVVASLGTEKQTGQIAKLLARFASDDNLALVDLNKDITPVWSKEYGLPFIYEQIFNDCGLKNIISNLNDKHKKLEFDLEKTVFNLILNRLIEPASEHRIINHFNETIYRPFVENIQLQHLYRAVKLLSEHKEEIEQSLFSKTRDLFNQKINLAFFDTTSVYLNGEESEDLAEYGYSKDKRPVRKQIIIGVLLGSNNMPIGCEIMSGGAQDVDALTKAIDSVKSRFLVDKIILVSDSGTNSEKNRELLKDKNLEYILGSRMRNSKAIKNYLKSNYPNSFKNSIIRENKNDLFYEEAILDNRRYLIIYNPQEAKRQRETRKQIVLKLETQLKKNGLKSLIKNKGQKRYLKVVGEGSVPISIGIDQEKVKNEEIFDGIFVCETNNLELAAEKVASEHKNLWQIERIFRNLKDVLEMRPIYHQIDTMITGHIFVSFLALYLEMYLRKKLHESKVEDIDRLIFEVSKIKAVQIQVKERKAVMRSEIENDAYQLFKALSLRPPDRILEKWS